MPAAVAERDKNVRFEHRQSEGPTAASLLALFGVLALTIAAYLFFITAGFSTRKLPENRYADRLAEGFVNGQLHILEAPSPALLAQQNPQDFKTSRHLWRIWDASLYDGKYYFYWGPLPALLAAATKLVAGEDTLVTDRALATAFALGRLLVVAAILALALRWFFPDLSRWHLAPAVLFCGLTNPSPYLLGRPGVYETAIESGQFFLLLGLLSALVAVRGCRTRARESWLLVAAGASWAGAIGCRISLLVAVGAVALLTALAASIATARPGRALVVRASAISTPLAVMLFALGLYNYARFGSFFDFGTDYMLTKRQFGPQASFVLPNLHSYLLRRFAVSCEFPFLTAPFFANALTPAWVPRDAGWIPQEPVVGMLVAIPALPLAAVALGAAFVRARRGLADPRDKALVWLAASCATTWLLAAVPTLGVWTATMRYLADVTPSALVLTIIGFWTALVAARQSGSRRAPRVVVMLGAILASYSVIVGVALGLQGGYYRVLKTHNPPLHAKLTGTLSLCDPSAPPPAKPAAKRP